MNILPKILLIVNLIHSIRCLNHDFTTKFIGNAKRNADKVSAANNKISKLRLILLSDLNNQNEIVRFVAGEIKKEEKYSRSRCHATHETKANHAQMKRESLFSE